jgi:hypothetical protein
MVMMRVTESLFAGVYIWARKKMVKMKIEKNLGTADKVVRLAFSAVVIILFLLKIIGGPMAAGLLALSVVLIITVLFSFCPVYGALGVNNSNESSPE